LSPDESQRLIPSQTAENKTNPETSSSSLPGEIQAQIATHNPYSNKDNKAKPKPGTQHTTP
jgi:hypothetical protein